MICEKLVNLLCFVLSYNEVTGVLFTETCYIIYHENCNQNTNTTQSLVILEQIGKVNASSFNIFYPCFSTTTLRLRKHILSNNKMQRDKLVEYFIIT
jgi:hypothetical protein